MNKKGLELIEIIFIVIITGLLVLIIWLLIPRVAKPCGKRIQSRATQLSKCTAQDKLPNKK